MCDNWRGCAENWRKESLASNQVVGSSNLSGHAIISTNYSALKNSTVQYLANCPIFFSTSKVVIYDCETMIALNQTSEC